LVVSTALAATAVAVGGSASAFWSAYGGGAGSTDTETLVALSLTPATPVADLYPGGSTDVLVRIANPNAASVQIGSMSLDTTQGAGGFLADAAHAGCGVTSLSFARATNSGMGWTVPGASGGTDGTVSATLTDALSMSLGAADACQGASFTVYLTVGP
jgi:hypothetical protein